MSQTIYYAFMKRKKGCEIFSEYSSLVPSVFVCPYERFCFCSNKNEYETNKNQNILFTYVWQKNKSFNMIRPAKWPKQSKSMLRKDAKSEARFSFKYIQFSCTNCIDGKERKRERSFAIIFIWNDCMRLCATWHMWNCELLRSAPTMCVCEREIERARIEARIVTKSKTNVYFSNIHFVTVDSWYRAKYVHVCWASVAKCANDQCLHCTHIRRWLKLLVKKSLCSQNKHILPHWIESKHSQLLELAIHKSAAYGYHFFFSLHSFTLLNVAHWTITSVLYTVFTMKTMIRILDKQIAFLFYFTVLICSALV